MSAKNTRLAEPRSVMMKAQPKGGKYGPYKTSRPPLRRTHHGCGGGASCRSKRDCGVHCRRTCRRTRKSIALLAGNCVGERGARVLARERFRGFPEADQAGLADGAGSDCRINSAGYIGTARV